MQLKNPKHERFCQEYIKDLNASAAAVRAGYSANGANAAAARMLTIANIQERIAELQKIVADLNMLEAKWIVERYKKIVELGMKQLESGEVTLKPSDTLAALHDLGTHLGMFQGFDQLLAGLKSYGILLYQDGDGNWAVTKESC
jgi:phage terminase small subunit